MKRLVLAVATLIALCNLALAQVPASVNVSWVAPATAVDGSPLTGSLAIIGYNVYVDTAPILDIPNVPAAVTIQGTATSTVASLTVANNSTLHIRVQACNVGGCSGLSQELTKDVSIPVPGVPTNVTVTIQIKP